MSLIARGAFAAVPAAATCAYPLDGDASVATAYAGGSGIITGYQAATSPGFNNVSRTLDGSSGNRVVTMPADLLSLADSKVIDGSSGIIAAEFEMVTGPESADWFGAGVYLAAYAPDGSGGTSSRGYFGVRLAYVGGVAYTVDENGDAPPSSIAGSLSGKRAGAYCNLSTGQFGFTVDGTDLGYISTTVPTDGTSRVGLSLCVSDSAASGAGLATEYRIITSAADFTEPFPAGATDFCGNAI